MKCFKNIIFFSVVFFCQLFAVQIRVSSNQVILENDRLVKEITFKKKQPGPIQISSLYSKATGENLVVQDGAPYFELFINKTHVTSQTPCWQYHKHTIRRMGNGGREVRIIFISDLSEVKGLHLEFIQQLFPKTSLIREKLILKASSDKIYKLHKREGDCHFVFPQYSVATGARAKSTEIRIATWANEQIGLDPNATYDDRAYEEAHDLNLSYCHMFHPDIVKHKLHRNHLIVTKGPFNIMQSGRMQWITAYEHGSQDRRIDIPPNTFGWEESGADFMHVGIRQIRKKEYCSVSVNAMRGGYLDGEAITVKRPYASVWTASAFSQSRNQNDAKAVIRDYLYRCICEQTASREPTFYYNTWGMQRDLQRDGEDIRGLFTEERILEEIRSAAELGVHYFVLDDGWQQNYGDWKPHRERLKDGLKPLRDEIEKHGMKMGIWLSTIGVAKETARYQNHPEWVIRDVNGEPVKHQGGHPAFDMVSSYKDTFVADCKWLIDRGARYFKWDAIDTKNSAAANLHHGSDQYSPLKRKERYEYLLPLYITEAMEELVQYQPDLVIEIDLTESRRTPVGLAVLSQGKYFWMNNGAAWYGDYSPYRAKSMRTIATQFSEIIPIELFTYANYPHNARPYYVQRYLVNSSLIGGHGFWGNLGAMTSDQRQRVGTAVEKSMQVLPQISGQPLDIVGRIGSSPEIYTQLNAEKSCGQVIAFSGQVMKYSHQVPVDSESVLAVLNHAYSIDNNQLKLPFEFVMPDDTREAFILSNEGSGISIASSTCWLNDVRLRNNQLTYICGAPGEQTIHWPMNLRKPGVKMPGDSGCHVYENHALNRYEITVSAVKAGMRVVVK